MASKKKKKTEETLSKKEKEIWKRYLEDFKRFYGNFKKQCTEGYKEVIFDYINHLETRIIEIDNKAIKAIIEGYKLTELKDLNELEDIIVGYQLIHALRGYISVYSNENKIEMEKLIMEEIQVGEDDSLKDIYLYHYKASDRLILKFDEYLDKETQKIKRQVYKEIIIMSEELENELIKTIDRKVKDIDLEIEKLINHINNIKCSAKNIDKAMLLNLKEKSIIEIDGFKLETISLTLNINQLVNENLGLNELKQSLSIDLSDGFKSSANNKPIKLKDGKIIYWDAAGLIIDAKDLAKKDFSYKDLNKYAEEKGYIKDRCTGDHMIYKKEGHENIIIPQKKLGRGLQQKILRDLDVI